MVHLSTVLHPLKPKTLLPIADVLLVNISIYIGLWLWTLRDSFREFDATFILSRLDWFLVLSITWLMLATMQQFYHDHATREPRTSLITVASIASLFILLYVSIYFFAPRDNSIPRGTILTIIVVSTVLVGFWRLVYIHLTAGLSFEQIIEDCRASFRPQSVSSGPSNLSETNERQENVSEETLLTVQEVSEQLKVSQATVWRWCQSGKLPAFRVGQQWRIRATDLQRAMYANGE